MVIIVAGPTGSGKTQLSIEIARFLFGEGVFSEIINADCTQLYADLKIISNHPSEKDFSNVKHHLYGILSPTEKSSAAFWLKKAKEITDRLEHEKKISILCGGTGFYINAMLNGLAEIPDIPSEIRENIIKKYNSIGRDAFFSELAALDPQSAKILHKNDTQRIMRAYEVVFFTGKPIYKWWNNEKAIGHWQKTLCFVLMPPREKLAEAISCRIYRMVKDGAIDEVLEFSNRFVNYSGPLCNAIGYREILSFLSKKTPDQNFTTDMHIKTMQYAKRQSTWFRNKMKSANFLHGFGNDQKIIDDVLNTIKNELP